MSRDARIDFFLFVEKTNRMAHQQPVLVNCLTHKGWGLHYFFFKIPPETSEWVWSCEMRNGDPANGFAAYRFFDRSFVLKKCSQCYNENIVQRKRCKRHFCRRFGNSCLFFRSCFFIDWNVFEMTEKSKAISVGMFETKGKNTFMASFNTTVRQITEMFQWPKCLG